MVDASKQEENKTSQLLSVVFKKGFTKRCHMQFFYSMDNVYGNILTVKRRTINNLVVSMETIETYSG